LGYSASEYSKNRLEELFIEQKEIKELLQRLGLQEIIHNFRATVKCRDGTLKQVLINAAPHINEDGAVYVFSTARSRLIFR
jgi:hypothetical protein